MTRRMIDMFKRESDVAQLLEEDTTPENERLGTPKIDGFIDVSPIIMEVENGCFQR